MMISNIYRDCFAQLSYEAVRDSGQPFLCFQNLQHILFQRRNMLYHESPKKLSRYAVITMNYSVSGIYDSFCVRKRECRLQFEYPIDSFSHDFNIPLDSPLPKNIFLEILKQFRLSLEETFNLLGGIQYIV